MTAKGNKYFYIELLYLKGQCHEIFDSTWAPNEHAKTVLQNIMISQVYSQKIACPCSTVKHGHGVHVFL